MRISNISAFAGGADDVVSTQLVNGSARNWDIDLTDASGNPLDLTGYSYEFDTVTATGDITPSTRGSSYTLANLALDNGATVEDRSNLLSLVGDADEGKIRLYLPSNLYTGTVPFDTDTGTPFVVGTIRIQDGDTNPTILSIRVLIVIRYGAISTGDVGDPPESPIPITIDWSQVTSKPTTIAGFGITDAFSGDYDDLTNKPTLYTDADVDAHINVSTATAGQALTWDGADYAWSTAATTYSDTDVATYLNGNLNTSIIPDTNDTYDIGSAEKKIRDIYVSDNSIKFVDDTDPQNPVEYPISRNADRIEFNGEALATKGERDNSKGGYEFTGGFVDRTNGQAGVSDIGTDVEYTTAMVTANTWLCFGLGSTQQLANDKPYWNNGGAPNEAPGAIYGADANNLPTGFTMDGANAYPDSYQGTGLFSGAYMPAGVNSLYAFGESTAYNAAQTSGSLQYTAADGSYNMSELNPGDFCQFRFDFNVTPQVANTTLEVGLIWQTRDANGDATFTFALTAQPIFFGEGTVGKTFLNRPIMTAYLASQEDVNARALPAIRSDNRVYVQPLTSLFTVSR